LKIPILQKYLKLKETEMN